MGLATYLFGTANRAIYGLTALSLGIRKNIPHFVKFYFSLWVKTLYMSN